MRLLVVDDDAGVSDLLVRALERDGHVVLSARDLRSARAALSERDTEVVVLDLGLPDGTGVELCREIRRARSEVPVLVLTAQNDVARRVEALDAGADDFLGKPFAVAELRARVRALGRRRRTPLGPTTWVRGALRIDLAARTATRGDTKVALTAREWAILETLALRTGALVSRTKLLEEVWGEATEAAEASLEVLVGRIRRKLGEGVVRTLRGEGYLLEAE